MKGIWRTWAEIEREEQERANKGKEMDVEERERGREWGKWGRTDFCVSQERGMEKEGGGRKGENREEKRTGM